MIHYMALAIIYGSFMFVTNFRLHDYYRDLSLSYEWDCIKNRRWFKVHCTALIFSILYYNKYYSYLAFATHRYTIITAYCLYGNYTRTRQFCFIQTTRMNLQRWFLNRSLLFAEPVIRVRAEIRGEMIALSDAMIGKSVLNRYAFFCIRVLPENSLSFVVARVVVNAYQSSFHRWHRPITGFE